MTELDLKEQWVVYLVECNDHSFYCGITNDLPSRIEVHNKGTGAKYTMGRGPVKLVAVSRLMNHCAAARLECYIKSLPHNKKIEVLKEQC